MNEDMNNVDREIVQTCTRNRGIVLTQHTGNFYSEGSNCKVHIMAGQMD